MMPLAVLQRAASEMVNFNGCGQSVMEMSHRTDEFSRIINKTESLLRKLMGVPQNYHVLFLQGGAWTQFAMVPINLAAVERDSPFKKAVYIDTGIWADKAISEASKYVVARTPASSKGEKYTYIPCPPPAEPDDAYYYICLNNTIMGTRWTELPATGGVPLVADVSSCILSEPIDVNRFGLVFAGAQKNLGPAGCTIVVIKDGLCEGAPSWAPAMLNYSAHINEKSLFNTPPCYCIYMIGLMLEWLDEMGGVEAAYKINQEKAALLYNYIDESGFYRAPVRPKDRSLMNVRFSIQEEDAEKQKLLEKRFTKQAQAAGLANLAGHRLAGGLRASIYNAMPIEGVRALIEFMNHFKKDV
jgi:phosphoserine aminotransferase